MNTDETLLWKQEDRKVLLETPVFTVTERTSIGPDGQTGKYIVNECRDWVIVVPVAGDKFLMVKQWRHGEQKLSTEFPGGVLDPGEKPEAGAARELKEETGYIAGKLTHLGTMNPNPALFANKVHIYCAEDLVSTGEQNLDNDEFVNYFEMDRGEVFAKMGTGEFSHVIMAAALGLYRNYFSRC